MAQYLMKYISCYSQSDLSDCSIFSKYVIHFFCRDLVWKVSERTSTSMPSEVRNDDSDQNHEST